MRNTNPQQAIIILGRKHTWGEVRNCFFFFSPSEQIDNRWIINHVWEWALPSHSGYTCWTVFFFLFIFSIPSFRLVAFPVQMLPSLIVPHLPLSPHHFNGFQLWDNCSNIVSRSPSLQLKWWKCYQQRSLAAAAARACMAPLNVNTCTFSDTSASSAFICFFAEFLHFGIKANRNPFSNVRLFILFCVPRWQVVAERRFFTHKLLLSALEQQQRKTGFF